MHEKRLRVLELQAAMKGINTPPETEIEIEDIQAEIQRYQQMIDELK